MKQRIIIKLALKNLWSHRLRTTLTILGVTIGISSIIFLVSLGYGLEQLVTNQVANFDAFTIVDVPSANISTIKIDDISLERIRKLGHVKETASVINVAGRIKEEKSDSTAETIITGGTFDYWKLSNTVVDSGHLPLKDNEIVVNKAVINLLGNDTNWLNKKLLLDVIIPADLRAQETDGLKENKDISVIVRGIIEESESPIVLISSGLMKKSGAVKYSSLKVKVDDRKNVEKLRKQLENLGFSTEYVGDTVDQISQVFSLFRIILGGFGLIALIVAALGTFNTLTISLLERTREVGLFKALGMRNKEIYKLFLAESMLIGTFGGFVGLALGLILGKVINLVLSILAQSSNADTISLFVTPWFFAVGVAVFSIVVGFLTGWYPSRRAVKIDPLDALRYE